MIIKLSTFFDLRATSHIFRAKAGHIIWITVPSLSFCLECSWCGAISSDYFGADHFLPQKPYLTIDFLIRSLSNGLLQYLMINGAIGRCTVIFKFF